MFYKLSLPLEYTKLKGFILNAIQPLLNISDNVTIQPTKTLCTINNITIICKKLSCINCKRLLKAK